MEGVTEESVKTIDGLRNAIHHFCANSFAVHYERRYTRCRLYLDSVEVIPRPGIGSLSQKHASPNKSLPISNLLNSLDKTLCENDLRTFWSSAQTITSTTQLPWYPISQSLSMKSCFWTQPPSLLENGGLVLASKPFSRGPVPKVIPDHHFQVGQESVLWTT